MNGLHSEDSLYRALSYPLGMPPLLFLIRPLPPLRPVENITGWEHEIDCEKREDFRIEVKSKGRKRKRKNGT